MNRLLLAMGCAMLFAGTVAANDSDIISLTDAVANTKKLLATECATQRQALPQATTASTKNRAEQGIIVNCDCAPGRLDRLVADPGIPREIERGSLKTLVLTVATQCGVVGMTTTLSRLCLGPDGPNDVPDRKAYCGCLEARGKAMTEDMAAAMIAEIRRNRFADLEQLKQKAIPADLRNQLERQDRECRATGK
jgi:hypothetical protein